MPDRSLVIFGSMKDPHVVGVVSRLMNRNIKCFFIDIFESFFLSQKFVNDDNIVTMKLPTLYGDFEEIDILSSIVWLRNKYIYPIIRNKQEQYNHYRLVESESFLKSILYYYEITHFNSISYRYSSDKKIIQLKYAQSVGLRVPRTLISNDKNDIITFLQSTTNKVIAKPLHSANILPTADGKDSGSYITVDFVDINQIQEAGSSSISAAPVQYQEYISKDYEIRALVTPLGCAAFKVDSQSSMSGMTDSRRAQDEDIYEIIVLPDTLIKYLVELIKNLGLVYGIMDLIYTKEHDYYFLECNADGQWVWIEIKCEESPATNLLSETIQFMFGR